MHLPKSFLSLFFVVLAIVSPGSRSLLTLLVLGGLWGSGRRVGWQARTTESDTAMKAIRTTVVASLAMFALLNNAAIAGNPWPGYTLISPIGSTTTSLIDNNGDIRHSWNTGYRPALSAYLQEDGSLMRTARLTGPGLSFNGTGGAGGRVERYDWDGTLDMGVRIFWFGLPPAPRYRGTAQRQCADDRLGAGQSGRSYRRGS